MTETTTMRERLAAGMKSVILLSLILGFGMGCDTAPNVEDIAAETNTVSSDVTYEYDALNRLTAVRYSNGDVIRYSYDEAGNILSVEMDAAE